ncbi:MAG: T9SS type A sorting domain-containing protein, partial [Spirochaetales bacterium]|nr:T9SS type A sorting domain-containing protein [Spirochaetales bacterium]
PTAVTINIENAAYDGTTFTADVVMEAVATVIYENTVMHAVLTESHIPEEWQGLDELNDVARNMYNGSAGTTVDLINNTTVTIPIEFTLDTSWIAPYCKVIVFVQDNDTKEILNGNKAYVQYLAPAINLSGELVNTNDVSLTWNSAADENVLSYNVYRDETLIGNTTDTSYMDLALADGIYEYFIKAVYTEGLSEKSNMISVTIGEVLCTPLYGTGCNLGDGFTDFILNEIQNTESGCEDLAGTGWSQYPDLEPAILIPGETDTITMAIGYMNQYATVWIDWNDDLVFSDDEKIISNFIMDEPGLMYDVEFVVPDGVPNGVHYMRARTNYNEECNDPCASYEYGETEDYKIQVGPNGTVETEKTNIKIYPNPAKDNISIKAPFKIERIELLNVSGREVLKQNVLDSYINLEVSNLTPGLYFIKV